ncbi:44871_t:CDS:1, partial [Gigaspora margarita]
TSKSEQQAYTNEGDHIAKDSTRKPYKRQEYENAGYRDNLL